MIRCFISLNTWINLHCNFTITIINVSVMKNNLFQEYASTAVTNCRVCSELFPFFQDDVQLTNSLECFDHARLQTCDPVSTHCRGWPVRVFQNLIHRSAVPPPLASRPCWWGDHAMALTAAKCSVYVCTGFTLVMFHTNSLLSLPPDAKCWWSGDHFKPQTWKKWKTAYNPHHNKYKNTCNALQFVKEINLQLIAFFTKKPNKDVTTYLTMNTLICMKFQSEEVNVISLAWVGVASQTKLTPSLHLNMG